MKTERIGISDNIIRDIADAISRYNSWSSRNVREHFAETTEIVRIVISTRFEETQIESSFHRFLHFEESRRPIFSARIPRVIFAGAKIFSGVIKKSTIALPALGQRLAGGEHGNDFRAYPEKPTFSRRKKERKKELMPPRLSL